MIYKITLELLPGSNVEDSIDEMISISDFSGRTVCCSFNGVKLTAIPHEQKSSMLKQYWVGIYGKISQNPPKEGEGL